MAEALEGLGYKYVAGPSGDTNDFVLRQTADLSNGFAWKGQDNYDKVGAAVTVRIREMLVDHCGLEEITDGLAPAAAFATPGWREHTGALEECRVAL